MTPVNSLTDETRGDFGFGSHMIWRYHLAGLDGDISQEYFFGSVYSETQAGVPGLLFLLQVDI